MASCYPVGTCPLGAGVLTPPWANKITDLKPHLHNCSWMPSPVVWFPLHSWEQDPHGIRDRHHFLLVTEISLDLWLCAQVQKGRQGKWVHDNFPGSGFPLSSYRSQKAFSCVLLWGMGSPVENANHREDPWKRSQGQGFAPQGTSPSF